MADSATELVKVGVDLASPAGRHDDGCEPIADFVDHVFNLHLDQCRPHRPFGLPRQVSTPQPPSSSRVWSLQLVTVSDMLREASQPRNIGWLPDPPSREVTRFEHRFPGDLSSLFEVEFTGEVYPEDLGDSGHGWRRVGELDLRTSLREAISGGHQRSYPGDVDEVSAWRSRTTLVSPLGC